LLKVFIQNFYSKLCKVGNESDLSLVNSQTTLRSKLLCGKFLASINSSRRKSSDGCHWWADLNGSSATRADRMGRRVGPTRRAIGSVCVAWP